MRPAGVARAQVHERRGGYQVRGRRTRLSRAVRRGVLSKCGAGSGGSPLVGRVRRKDDRLYRSARRRGRARPVPRSQAGVRRCGLGRIAKAVRSRARQWRGRLARGGRGSWLSGPNVGRCDSFPYSDAGVVEPPTGNRDSPHTNAAKAAGVVEHRRVELLTSCMPCKRSTN